MGFVRNFVRRIGANATSDIRYMNNEGASEKADIIYMRIKSFFSGGWNLIIDKVIDLILKSAEKDVDSIFKLSKSNGFNPFDFFPDNVMKLLDPKYVSAIAADF